MDRDLFGYDFTEVPNWKHKPTRALLKEILNAYGEHGGLLTLTHARLALGVSRTRISQMLNEGILTRVDLCGEVLVPVGDVIARVVRPGGPNHGGYRAREAAAA